jgi:hypothetical protein
MGHFTVLGATIDAALAKAEALRQLLSWSADAPGPRLVRSS